MIIRLRPFAHPAVIGYFILAAAMAIALGRVEADAHRIVKIETAVRPYAPLTHTVPTSDDKIVGVVGPAIRRGTPLHLTVTLCNTTTTVVHGLSSLSWQAVDAAGVGIVGESQTVYSGIPQDRQPGCHPYTRIPFAMPVTAVVIDATLTAEHIAHRWHLIGGATPVRPDGTFGTRDAFTSPTFTVVP